MNITSYELDEIARPGLEALRSAVIGDADDKVMQQAELTLKLLGKSQSRMSAETNRLALTFRIARHVQADRETVSQMLQGLLPTARAPKEIEQETAQNPMVSRKAIGK